MSEVRERLSAEDYTYLLPDHWLLKEQNIWTMMHHAYVSRVVETIRDSGAKRVIEVGCGDGWNCGKMVEAGLDVVGVDWSRNGIDHARRMVPEGTFFCGDITDDEFMQTFREPFDAGIMVEVIEHIPSDQSVGALRKILSFIKPGGVFVLTTPSVNVPNNNVQHYRHFTESVLRDLIEEVGGLTITQIEGYGDGPYERFHYQVARFFDNRLFTIYPARDWFRRRYQSRCLHSPLNRCHGFIVTMRRVEES